MLNLTNTMAPKVEVLYFDTYGRVEIIRTILNYGGIEFEDKRFQVEEWAATKPSEKLQALMLSYKMMNPLNPFHFSN